MLLSRNLAFLGQRLRSHSESVPSGRGGWRPWVGRGRTWLRPSPRSHLAPGHLPSGPGALGTAPKATQRLPPAPQPPPAPSSLLPASRGGFWRRPRACSRPGASSPRAARPHLLLTRRSDPFVTSPPRTPRRPLVGNCPALDNWPKHLYASVSERPFIRPKSSGAGPLFLKRTLIG